MAGTGHIAAHIHSIFHRDEIEATAARGAQLGEGVLWLPITSRIIRWAFADWKRIEFLNKYFGATFAPRLQLDLIPGIACAAHFVIMAPAPPQTVDDYVAAGRDVQRVWLTATKHNLWQQPELTPLIFSNYVRTGIKFSASLAHQNMAERLAERFESLTSPAISERAVWMGRLGSGPPPSSRSLRLPLDRLMVT